MTIDTLTITYVYEFMDGALKLTARLTSSAEENQLINGVAFLVRGIDMDKETSTFEYPGSTPAGVYSFKEYTKYRVTATDYSSPVTCLSSDNPAVNLNVLFIDEVEKWTTSAYYDEKRQAGGSPTSPPWKAILKRRCGGGGQPVSPAAGRTGQIYRDSGFLRRAGLQNARRAGIRRPDVRGLPTARWIPTIPTRTPCRNTRSSWPVSRRWA